MNKHIIGWMIVTGLVAACSGCTPLAKQKPSQDSTRNFTRESIRESGWFLNRQLEHHRDALAEFAIANYYKPKPDQLGGQIDELAPLIVQQVNHSQSIPPLEIGLAFLRADGSLGVDTSQPTIYAEVLPSSFVEEGGAIVSYAWVYNLEDQPSIRGISMMLDANGFPKTWIPFSNDPNHLPTVYIATSLEEEASQALGSPQPGRMFSAEKAVQEQPDMTVVRAIPSGPVPMGPFVYLTEQSARISSIVCRCMPAQVFGYRRESWYRLAPMQELRSLGLETIGNQHYQWRDLYRAWQRSSS